MLQEEARDLANEYKNDKTTGKRRGEIIDRLRTLGSEWNAAGCRAAYGDITVLEGLPGYGRPGQEQLPVPQQEVDPVDPRKPGIRPQTSPVPQPTAPTR